MAYDLTKATLAADPRGYDLRRSAQTPPSERATFSMGKAVQAPAGAEQPVARVTSRPGER